MKAIRMHAYGGPDVLKYEDVPEVEPKAGEVLVRAEAIGVNFIDIYHRTGLYPMGLPFTPGSEAAGTVIAVGTGVTGFKVGDRVAQTLVRGSYAEAQTVEASKLVLVPDGVDARAAAAIMLQGSTAHYLCHSTFSLQAGNRALVHAAAGGVGLLLTQLAKKLGATVYGTVSTDDKARLAREAGADEVIIYTRQDFESEVSRLTGGDGVDVVYDSVGQATFEKSLNSLRRRGCLVSFGNSSGRPEPFSTTLLATKGSLFVTRPNLVDYLATRDELLQRTGDLFAWYATGDLKLRIGDTFPLSDAAEAHRQLEGRKTTGKLLLIP